MDLPEAADAVESVLDEVAGAVITREEFLGTLLTAVVAGGHVLLEDVPGTGKTLTARTLATALGLEFSRVQFTPDLLPADVTGSYVFDERDGSFEFREGPVFGNVVLADEINRAPPKTQAALLEAMSEGQVTVDGTTHHLPDPFVVLATMNPVEQEGTFPLPEAQRDRFWMKASIGYPDPDREQELLDRRAARDHGIPAVESVLDASGVTDLQAVPERVTVQADLRAYMTALVQRTRRHGAVEVGVSPRGLQRLFELARARAVLECRAYVVPGDVERVAVPTLSHRLVLSPEARVGETDPVDVVDDVLHRTPAPAVEAE
jgi:MoxR-like ATPase